MLTMLNGLGVMVIAASLGVGVPPIEMPPLPRPADDTRQAPDDRSAPSPTHTRTGDAGSGTRRASARADAPTKYVLIELHGVIGEDILASGLHKALDGARDRRVERILFDIDSLGGSASEMFEILRVLDEHQGRFVYTAHVRRALSAMVPVMLTCDEILLEDTASFGAAVPYRATGTIEVDAKFASAIGAEIASRGARHGLSSMLCEAMAEMRKEVWLVRGGPSGPVVHNMRPSDPQALQLDGPTTVLTLSAQAALELGVGTLWDGRSTFDDSWREIGSFARREMEKARKDRAERLRDIEDVKAWSARLPTMMREAESLERFVPMYRSRYNDYWSSQDLSRFDAAIDAWVTVQKGVAQIEAKVRRHRDHDWDRGLLAELNEAERRANAAVSRLRNARNR